jgi:large subunit ribosomal protein L15
MYRKLPKRGFSNFKFRTEYAIVNVGDLGRVEGDTVDRDSLVRAGLVRSSSTLVKVLGEGEVEKAFTVRVDKVSSSARAKLEKAGGSIETPAASGKAEADAATE